MTHPKHPRRRPPFCYRLTGSRLASRGDRREGCEAIVVDDLPELALERLLALWPSFWPDAPADELHPAHVHREYRRPRRSPVVVTHR